MIKKKKQVKPLSVLTIEQAKCLLTMINSIDEYLMINEIELYEFKIDYHILEQFGLKLIRKIKF